MISVKIHLRSRLSRCMKHVSFGRHVFILQSYVLMVLDHMSKHEVLFKLFLRYLKFISFFFWQRFVNNTFIVLYKSIVGIFVAVVYLSFIFFNYSFITFYNHKFTITNHCIMLIDNLPCFDISTIIFDDQILTNSTNDPLGHNNAIVKK